MRRMVWVGNGSHSTLLQIEKTTYKLVNREKQWIESLHVGGEGFKDWPFVQGLL